jgi:ABC-type glycerol-3-phosphate transport system permease component
MNLRTIISAILAVVAAYFLLQFAWWLLKVAFSIALGILSFGITLVLVAVIAIPLYMVIKNQLGTSRS